MGAMLRFVLHSFGWLFQPPLRVWHIIRQMHFVGFNSTFAKTWQLLPTLNVQLYFNVFQAWWWVKVFQCQVRSCLCKKNFFLFSRLPGSSFCRESVQAQIISLSDGVRMERRNWQYFVGQFVLIGFFCMGYLASTFGKLKLNGGDYYQLRPDFSSSSG